MKLLLLLSFAFGIFSAKAQLGEGQMNTCSTGTCTEISIDRISCNDCYCENGNSNTAFRITNRQNLILSVRIYYELKSGNWVNLGSYGVQRDAIITECVNNNATGKYVAYYYYYYDKNISEDDLPSEDEVKRKYGKKVEELWGFCYAINGATYYISQPFKYKIDDAQIGYPETNIIKSWRIFLKQNPSLKYNQSTFKVGFSWGYECFKGGGALKIKTEQQSEEQRDCYISNITDKYNVNMRKIKSNYDATRDSKLKIVSLDYFEF